MAIISTGAIYKSLVFDGESSRDYGIYITGQAVYNAPERDVEMINIPGRNGSFALDKGRFQNIEVTYPAGIFADNEADFAQGISDFRNFLCSRNGYVRLTDDYNPDEYRMAVYKSGLDVSPAQLKAGEFQLVFDCKPQRYLTSGEEAIDVDSGDTITNPTLFEASPLLEVEGYGDIVVGGETVSIENVPIGEIKISNETRLASSTIGVTSLNTGDSIYSLDNRKPRVLLTFKESGISLSLRSVTNGTAEIYNKTSNSVSLWIFPSGVTFAKGTASTITTTVSVIIDGTNATLTVTTSYNGSRTITLSRSTSGVPSSVEQKSPEYSHPAYYGDSSKSALTIPIYIDLEIGEAYGEQGGAILDLNNAVSLPANLPTLAVGDTEITFDNTITSLDVKPRWWKV